MSDADFCGLAGRADRVGPFFCVFLKLNGDAVAEMRFVTYQCPWAIAAGSVLTELVAGQKLALIGEINEEALERELGEVPPSKVECLSLAICALRDSLRQRTGREGQ